MTLFKISTLILFYFISRAVFATPPCEKLTGLKNSETVCWNNHIKGWVSESCKAKGCDALTFFKSPKTAPKVPSTKGGRNPAAMICHSLNYEVVILKDSHKDEQSYCVFPDKTLVSVDAVERHVK